MVREVIRTVQDCRKKLGLPIEQRVHLVLDVDEKLKAALLRFEHVLQENVLLTSVRYAKEADMVSVSFGDNYFGLLIE